MRVSVFALATALLVSPIARANGQQASRPSILAAVGRDMRDPAVNTPLTFVEVGAAWRVADSPLAWRLDFSVARQAQVTPVLPGICNGCVNERRMLIGSAFVSAEYEFRRRSIVRPYLLSGAGLHWINHLDERRGW
jgi:hypothetical protein